MTTHRLFAGLLVIAGSALAQSTDHDNNARTAWNTSESVLSAATIAAPVSFQQLASYSTDGAVWGQPIYVPALTIGGAPHNAVIVATMHNSIYAFDADAPGSAPLWHAGPLAPSSTAFLGVSTLIGPEIGCSATPVADVANNRLYALCVDSAPLWTLYQLNLSTGVSLTSTVITATVPGTGWSGDNVSGGNLTFSPQYSWSRTGLVFANGNIYISFSGYLDPWHGWIMGYSTSTMTQIGALCTTPNGHGGGIWQTGGAPAVDASGNLYLATGDGTYDGTADFGMSVLKLSPTLAILDWFTPSNYAALNAADADLSSGQPMLPPGTALAVVGFKDFNVYSINTSCMGHMGGTAGGCTAPQIFPTGSGTVTGGSGIYGGMFANGVGYWPNTGGNVYSFALSGSTWNPSPTAVTTGTYTFPGAMMSASSNGPFGSLVWAITFAASAPAPAAMLHAWNAATLAEIWSSPLGATPHFAVPAVANGRVYIGQTAGVAAFGLSSSGLPAGGGISTCRIVTSMRAYGSVYQNTTGKPMTVTVTDLATSPGGNVQAYSDSNNPPVAFPGGVSKVSSGGYPAYYPVPTLTVLPGNYYRLTNSGTGAPGIWTECY